VDVLQDVAEIFRDIAQSFKDHTSSMEFNRFVARRV
jgi:hypothetical protein